MSRILSIYASVAAKHDSNDDDEDESKPLDPSKAASLFAHLRHPISPLISKIKRYNSFSISNIKSVCKYENHLPEIRKDNTQKSSASAEPLLNRQLPILPVRLQTSTFGL